MGFIVVRPIETNRTTFIDFWSRQYNYELEHVYESYIGEKLTEESILELYKWKNGRSLSHLKEASVRRNYILRASELSQLSPNAQAAEFLNRFAEGGAIWRIFWLHCWQPHRFPIYDQHVHRAMAFIQTGKIEELSKARDSEKIHLYLSRYTQFFATFDGIFGIPRAVDKALLMFGSFIKSTTIPLDHSKPLLISG